MSQPASEHRRHEYRSRARRRTRTVWRDQSFVRRSSTRRGSEGRQILSREIDTYGVVHDSSVSKEHTPRTGGTESEGSCAYASRERCPRRAARNRHAHIPRGMCDGTMRVRNRSRHIPRGMLDGRTVRARSSSRHIPRGMFGAGDVQRAERCAEPVTPHSAGNVRRADLVRPARGASRITPGNAKRVIARGQLRRAARLSPRRPPRSAAPAVRPPSRR
jgi:hypothetical protein